MHYIPDFHLISSDEYVEVKGWMSPKDKMKMDTFVKDGYILHLVDRTVIDNIHLDETTKYVTTEV
jgi:hypothetical protein